MITFGTVCSGIGSPEAAWSPLGWRASFASEIEPFPRAVLKHHYPETPLHGDFTTIQAGEYADIDVLCGGTPCQSFSVAGLRGGMADTRGSLALEYLRLADRLRPRWVVYENVPGILSSNGGRDFGSLLGGLAELGYGFAYRSLDAQFFNLAQRRQRVFVVGYLGDWRRAAAVLFEPASLRGNPAPSREARKDAATTISARTSGGGGLGTDFDCDGGLIARRLNAHPSRSDGESETFVVAPPLTHNPYGDHESREGLLVAHALTANGFDASEDGTGRGVPLVPCEPYTLAIRGRNGGHDLEYRQDGLANAVLTPTGGRAGIGCGAIAFSCKDHGADAGAVAPTLRAMGHAGSHANAVGQVAVAFDCKASGHAGFGGQVAVAIGSFQQNSMDGRGTLGFDGDTQVLRPIKPQPDHQMILQGYAVRRLTPKECARLQGFSDTYLDILYRGKPAADGPKYRALGNSMAVNVMSWLGKRIEIQHRQAIQTKEIAA